LAGYLGMTVARLSAEADDWEIAHWKALERIDGPISSWRDDYRAGMICSWIAASAESELDPNNAIPPWDRVQREKYEAAQAESLRLQRAQRNLRGEK
jgi:hypothetical protein